MESNLIDVEKNIYLETLGRRGIYKTYLSSLIDIISKTEIGDNKVSSWGILNIIKRLNNDSKKEQSSHITPILTASDAKKNYIYNILKDKFPTQIVLYIPICPIYVRIFYHVYNCLIEELGFEIIDIINLDPQAIGQYDIYKAIYKYQQKSDNYDLVKRWFYEDKLNYNEKRELGLSTNISDDTNSLEIIKLITESFKNKLLFFFDDIELINEKYGKQYGNKWGEKAQVVFLNTLTSLYKEVKNIIILLPCTKESWQALLSYSNNYLRNLLESEKIDFYDLEELKRKISKVMNFYWIQNNMRPPANLFFPLNDDLLEAFFEQAQGNLETFFNLSINRIEDILSGRFSSEDLD